MQLTGVFPVYDGHVCTAGIGGTGGEGGGVEQEKLASCCERYITFGNIAGVLGLAVSIVELPIPISVFTWEGFRQGF